MCKLSPMVGHQHDCRDKSVALQALQWSRSPTTRKDGSSMDAAVVIVNEANHPLQQGARRVTRSNSRSASTESDVAGGRVAEDIARGRLHSRRQDAGTSIKVETITTPLPRQRLGRQHARAEAVVISLSSSPECIVDLTHDSPPIDLTQS